MARFGSHKATTFPAKTRVVAISFPLPVGTEGARELRLREKDQR